MYKISYPLKDATIYENRPEQNTGIDQILELRKFAKGESYETSNNKFAGWNENYNSRILIKFDLSSLIEDETYVASGSRHYLTLKTTETVALPLEYSINAYPLSEDWVNGNGNFNDSPQITNGVSWKYKSNAEIEDEWQTGTIEFATVSGGGSWNDSYEATQSFKFNKTSDIRMDVTDIVNAWIDTTIPNHGFIIKRPQSDETDFKEYGIIKFFSKETHTIYIPTLQSYWNTDPIYTGSFLQNDEIKDDFIVYAENLRDKYTQNESIRLRLVARDSYPTKSYVRNQTEINKRRLPENTTFSVIDYVTRIPIIEFDEIGTRVLTDNEGHYIDLNFNNFLPVRYYSILLKIRKNGRTYVYENHMNFRIER